MCRQACIFFRLALIASLTIGYSNLIFGKPIEIELPVTQDMVLCAPSVVNLTATGSTGIYRWYTSSSGGYSFLNPTSIFVSRTTTFYVSAVRLEDNKYVESDRVPLAITINRITQPTTDTVSICGASHNYLFASGAQSNEVYCWYSDSLSHTPIKISDDEHDRNLFEYIDSFSTFYVSIRNLSLGCESNRSRIPINIKPAPSAPMILSEPTICGSGTIQFEVQDEAGYAFLWYPCQTGCGYYMNRGGTGPSYNGNSFETFLYNYSSVSTYTVWVEKISLTNFCTSQRVPLTATSYKVEAPIVPRTVYKCRTDIDTVLALLPAGQNSSVIIWYGDKEKTQLLGKGNSFAIPSSIRSRTAVYAVLYDSLLNHCESEIEEGEVMIYPGEVPTEPSVSVSENCGEVIFSVQQSANSGRYLWYTYDTLNAVHTGDQLINSTNNEYASDAFYVCFETSEGCIGQKTRVEGRPLAIMQAPQAPSVERCGPGSMKLNVTGNGKFTRYRWYNSLGYLIVGEYDSEYTTPYLYYSSNYSVTMIGDNGCESEKRDIQAVVKPGPSIGASNDFICRGESVALYGAGGNMYQWSENNIMISNRVNIYVNPFITTTYTLTDPTVVGPCRSASFTIQVNKNTECEALELENNSNNSGSAGSPLEPAYKIYPNPFTDEFSIHGSFQEAACRIMDLTGTELYYFPVGSIDIKSIKPFLNPGHYILEIKTSEKVYREKLIKL
jgi:hypothetical protein